MREFIERFAYRFQLWRKERYGEYASADPTAPRNPLRFAAIVAVVSVFIDVSGPTVFHRPFDFLAVARIPVALIFLVFYQSKSQRAWHLLVAWLPFAFFAYWILRFTGYPPYQPRVNAALSNFIFGLLHTAISVAIFIWAFRVRDRYFRYIQETASGQ